MSVTLSNEKLFDQAKKLVEYLNCIGPVGVRFKFDEDDQEYKVMEINSRFSVGVNMMLPVITCTLTQNLDTGSYRYNPDKRVGYYLWNPLTDIPFFFSIRFLKEFRQNLSIINKPKIIIPLDIFDLKPFKAQVFMIIKSVWNRLSKWHVVR